MTVFARRFLSALLVVCVTAALLASFVGCWVLPSPGNLAALLTLVLIGGCVAYAAASRT